jgi:3-oxoacyl-[acyl-carrier protein] reductase
MRALVTGASRGIGRETALRLGRRGDEVAVHYFRHREDAESAASEIVRAGGRAWTVGGDLGDRAAVDRIANEVAGRWNSLDILVNNAGVYPRVPFRSLDDEAFEACVRTNVFGPAALTRRLLPLLDRSESGRIVFVSSVLAVAGSGHGAHYAASKAALLGLARSLALELAPKITVNAVAPGSIDTDILAGDSRERRAERERQIPMHRLGLPGDVADTIVFLASPQAAYVTGATIHVNGGLRPE